MQTQTATIKKYADRKVWFSMWFLGAIVTFGVAFFPMFYRLVAGRNGHLQKQAEIEAKMANYLKSNGKQAPESCSMPKNRNLTEHEKAEDAYLQVALPDRVFMTQTIPQTTYVLITIVTLGVGGVYWLYKIVNLYNQHYKADLIVEKEINRILEEEGYVKHM
jgi:hypothetical protein